MLDKTIGNKLFFEQPIWTSQLRPSSLEFAVFAGIILIRLSPGVEKEYGLIGGSEGLGSEFFFDSQGLLCEVDLEIKPYDFIEAEPMYLLARATDLIKSHSRTGHLKLKRYSKAPLNPYSIWLLEPFGSAILAFNKNITIKPIEKFVQQLERMEVVEVAQGVWVVIDKEHREMQLVMVEGFEKKQFFGHSLITGEDFTFSEETHGRTTMETLWEIEMRYYEFPDPEEFELFAARKLLQLEKTEDVNELTLKWIQKLINSCKIGLAAELDLYKARLNSDE